jgi:spoIIIJ-associated protein
MLSQTDLEKIKKITEEFFEKTTFEVEIEFQSPRDQTIPINLKVDEPQILIGEGGQTLVEIQHLLKTILKRTLRQDQGKKLSEEPFFVDLDINGYKKKKIEYLKELARTLADEVAITKKEKILSPMPAYERRIIHLELAQRSDVTTESIGQEPERKLVIRPYP